MPRSNTTSRATFAQDSPSQSHNNSTAVASPPLAHNFKPAPFVKKIKTVMYNFGSPRVGNGNFASYFDKIVPCSYRVVVDGDIVPALPPQTKYTHVGTEILIDSVGAGSIIIDPSFVERWLRTHMKSSVAVHSLLVYRKGLLGIKLSAEFMRANANAKDTVDPLRLALKVRTHHQVNSILDENAGIAGELVPRDLELSHGGGESLSGRDDSVSDIIAAKVPCRDHDDRGPSDSPLSDLELIGGGTYSVSLPTTPRDAAAAAVGVGMGGGGGDFALEEMENPIIRMQQQQQQLRNKLKKNASGSALASGGGGGESKEGGGDATASTAAHDMAALHYANDVTNMEALAASISAMRTPGPVRWMKNQANQASRRFNNARGNNSPMRGGNEGASRKGNEESPSGKMQQQAVAMSPGATPTRSLLRKQDSTSSTQSDNEVSRSGASADATAVHASSTDQV